MISVFHYILYWIVLDLSHKTLRPVAGGYWLMLGEIGCKQGAGPKPSLCLLHLLVFWMKTATCLQTICLSGSTITWEHSPSNKDCASPHRGFTTTWVIKVVSCCLQGIWHVSYKLLWQPASYQNNGKETIHQTVVGYTLFPSVRYLPRDH